MKPVCSGCGAVATVVVRQDGDKRRWCDACLRQREPLTAVWDILARLDRPRNRTGVCPHCGWTRDRLEQEAHVGCPLCYEALEAPLLKSFERQ